MKKILILTALAFLSFSQMVGGFGHVYTNEELAEFANNEMFKSAELAAREKFSLNHNAVLGKVVSVSQQVVAGVNYKITFSSPIGEYTVVVFMQPWTNTVHVHEFEKGKQIASE